MPEENKIKVMVVDDEFHITTLLQSVLELSGYEVMVASDGVQALELADLKTPDVILLDINMPRMDGWTACAKLKEQEKTKNIPIIIVTAYTQREHKEKSFKAGCDAFVNKPFQIEEILEYIKKFSPKRPPAA